MKKAWVSSELARLSVTGTTDPLGKPIHFCCQLSQSDVSVLTHGSFEILRHYQSAKYFAMDRRLRLETPGWWVLDFGGNTIPLDKIEREWARLMRTPLLRRDREYPVCEDLISDKTGVVGPQLPILA